MQLCINEMVLTLVCRLCVLLGCSPERKTLELTSSSPYWSEWITWLRFGLVCAKPVDDYRSATEGSKLNDTNRKLQYLTVLKSISLKKIKTNITGFFKCRMISFKEIVSKILITACSLLLINESEKFNIKGRTSFSS